MAKQKLITHNGAIHADDLFACATLMLLMEKRGKRYEVIRTRDVEMIENGDVVFDVGGIYDGEKNRFDHHQHGGAGARLNGIKYASFGLVWKHFGPEICDGDMSVWKNIEDRIATPIDAFDNGMDLITSKYPGISTYSGTGVFLIHNPTWKESNANMDEIFVEQAEKVCELLRREIKVAMDDSEGTELILKAYTESEDKRMVVLDTDFPRYLYQNVLSSVPEPLYVVSPSAHGKNWKVEAISKNYKETLESRKPFPEAWSGYINHGPNSNEMPDIPGLVFSHNGRFYMVMSDKDSALAIAKRAVEI